ncbi:MAG: ExbD/TolR family protein [Puniceicoccaceae bacterium]
MRRRLTDRPEIPIAPMIDCVFLMLVYFMTTSSLEKSEADLAFPAGQAGIPADPLPAVDEQRLLVQSGGQLMWNGTTYGLDSSGRALLEQRLVLFRDTCLQAGSEPSLRVEPDDAVNHQELVALLDAITRSEIETIHFP